MGKPSLQRNRKRRKPKHQLGPEVSVAKAKAKANAKHATKPTQNPPKRKRQGDTDEKSVEQVLTAEDYQFVKNLVARGSTLASISDEAPLVAKKAHRARKGKVTERQRLDTARLASADSPLAKAPRAQSAGADAAISKRPAFSDRSDGLPSKRPKVSESDASDQESLESSDSSSDLSPPPTRVSEPSIRPANSDITTTARASDGQGQNLDRDSTFRELNKFVGKQSTTEDKKTLMAALGLRILEDPEESGDALSDLFEMCSDKSRIIRKFAILSMLNVFKDIIPGYRIREPTEEERANLSKNVKKLWDWEALLLAVYKKYLALLESLAKQMVMKATRKDRRTGVSSSVIAVRQFRNLAVECMCILLVEKPHFNFQSNIVTALVPHLNSDDSSVAQQCFEAIKTMFRSDKDGSVTTSTVKYLTIFIKNRNFVCNPRVIELFHHIVVTDALGVGDVTYDAPKRHLTNKQKKKMTKKQQEAYKELQEVEKDVRKAEEEKLVETRKWAQADILRMVYITYFRILKKSRTSPLLPKALIGLGKFAHFINVDFISDIVEALKDLIHDPSEGIPVSSRLACAFAAFHMIGAVSAESENAGTPFGSALDVDLKELFGGLFSVLPIVPIAAVRQTNLIEEVVRCLDSMPKGRSQLEQRMAAFAKRMAMLSLHVPPHASLALLATVFQLLKDHPRCRSLLEHNLVGFGAYDPYVKDPAHSNALASTLWELTMLKHHYHPLVSQYAGALISAFEDGPSHTAGISFPYADLKPMSLFAQFNSSKGGYNPPPAVPPDTHPFVKRQKKLESSKRKDHQKHVFISGERAYATSRFLQRCVLEESVKKEEVGGGGIGEALATMWDEASSTYGLDV